MTTQQFLELFQQLYVQMIPALAAVSIIALASNVMIGLAVYNHARMNGNKKALLWGVLSGVVTVTALIYLIVQLASKPKQVYCVRCGCPLTPDMTGCPNCNWPAIPTRDYVDEQAKATYKRRMWIFLIIWIALCVASIIVYAVLMMNMVTEITNIVGQLPGLNRKIA